MKINRFTILIALIPFLVDVRGVPAWASYPVVILIAFLCLMGPELNKRNSFAMAVLMLILTALFRWEQFSPRLFKDIGLMAMGVSPFIFKNHFRVEAKSLNLLMIIGFYITISSDIVNYKLSVENFINSTFGIERGAFTYSLGLFSLYWMKHGNLKWAAINFFLMLLGGKRVAMVGAAVCILLSFLLWKKKGETPVLVKIGLAAAAILYLKFSYDFATGVYDDIILAYTEKSADAFAMGRQQLYSKAFEFITFPNIWGEGPGNLYTFLEMKLNMGPVHNDFLKIYVDDGVILGLVWLWIWLSKLKYDQLPTVVFMFALFCTTNTLIYVYMLFMFCLFLDSEKYIYIGEILVPENMHMKKVREKLELTKKNETAKQ